MNLQNVLQWALLNIFVSLLPVVLNVAVFRMLRYSIKWTYYLRNGEMLFYATVISAVSISDRLFAASSKPLGTASVSIMGIMILVALLSSVLFCCLTLLAYMSMQHPRSRVVGAYLRNDDGFVAMCSIALAVAAAVFSFLSFTDRV